jgi:tetratricopeptide (TPR) repeat protein
MPFANLESSFEAAARHLFRNLTDPRKLQRNPIVRRFFEDSKTGRMMGAKESQALTVIHRLIIQGAEYCRKTDIEARKQEQAHRQYTIVTKCSLQGESLSSVAAELGISIRQCYRERANIFKRIALYLSSYSPISVPSASCFLDAFRFQMNKAITLTEAADIDNAIHIYDDLIRSGGEIGHRLEALCKRADLSLELGEFEHAQSLLSEMHRMLAACGRSELSQQAAEATRAHLDLIWGKLKWSTADFFAASAAIQRSVARSEAAQQTAGKRAKELYVEILVESAEHLLYQGDFAGATVSLQKAQSILNCVLLPSLLRRLDVTYGLANLNDVAKGRETWPLARRIVVLQELAELAQTSGSLWRAVRTSANLVAHYAFSHDYSAAREVATGALAIAKQFPSRQIKLTILDLAEALLVTTPYWRQVPAILQWADEAIVKNSMQWIYSQLLWSFYFLRAGDYVQAWARADAAQSAAVRAAAPRQQGAAERNRAVAAQALGQRERACESLASALSIVIRHGSLLSCRETYRVAASITGERRFQQQAKEITRLLSA